MNKERKYTYILLLFIVVNLELVAQVYPNGDSIKINSTKLKNFYIEFGHRAGITNFYRSTGSKEFVSNIKKDRIVLSGTDNYSYYYHVKNNKIGFVNNFHINLNLVLFKNLRFKFGLEYEFMKFGTNTIDTLITSFHHISNSFQTSTINNSTAQVKMNMINHPIGLEYYIMTKSGLFYGVNISGIASYLASYRATINNYDGHPYEPGLISKTIDVERIWLLLSYRFGLSINYKFQEGSLLSVSPFFSSFYQGAGWAHNYNVYYLGLGLSLRLNNNYYF